MYRVAITSENKQARLDVANLINDVDLKEISLDSLFEISSFVEQNVFVFDDSIINNITMYSNFNDELINDVSESAFIGHTIKNDKKSEIYSAPKARNILNSKIKNIYDYK